MRSQEAQVNGATIRYSDSGEGPVLLLIHGGLGAGSEWEPIARELAGSFRVIVPDSRGHGRSSNPSGELSYPQLADDAAALAGSLRLNRPTVVGWSDGGQVALELAARHPEVAGSLVVGGAYPEFERSGLRDTHRDLLREIEEGPEDEELRELKALHDDWDALIAQTRGMWLDYPGLPPEKVAAISLPTLVISGDRDEIVPISLQLKLQAELPNSELAVVPGAGHSGPFTPARASIFAALIKDFIERQEE